MVEKCYLIKTDSMSSFSTQFHVVLAYVAKAERIMSKGQVNLYN